MTLNSACQKHLTQKPQDYCPHQGICSWARPLPDVLTLKMLAWSLRYHWLSSNLGRWALDAGISRPPFKEWQPSAFPHETYNPYSILWPGILLQKKWKRTPLNGFTVILNPFDDAGVLSHLTLIMGKILELVYKANLNAVWSTLEMPQFPLAGLGGPREPTVPTAHTWPLSSSWTTRRNSCLGLQTRLLL